jgi:hypothetical protein
MLVRILSVTPARAGQFDSVAEAVAARTVQEQAGECGQEGTELERRLVGVSRLRRLGGLRADSLPTLGHAGTWVKRQPMPS